MEPTSSTGLLHRSWKRAWRGIGAVTSGEALRDRLLTCYGQPQRHYHTLQHLAECMAAFESVARLAQRSAEIEIALWFHDAVYDVRGGDNEKRSAEWAIRELRAASVANEVCERVHAMIMATLHAALSTDPDTRLLVDIDLAILGAEPARFAEYDSQIRAEYAFVPDWLYRRKRQAILELFLARPHIYGTPSFQASHEARARRNLSAAIESSMS